MKFFEVALLALKVYIERLRNFYVFTSYCRNLSALSFSPHTPLLKNDFVTSYSICWACDNIAEKHVRLMGNRDLAFKFVL